MIAATAPQNQWPEQVFWQMIDYQMRHEIAFQRANNSSAPIDRDAIVQKIMNATLDQCMPAGNA